MPPAFYFPENQTPPSDLNGSTSDSSGSVGGKRKPYSSQDGMQMLNLEIPSSESEMNSPKGSSHLSSSLIDKTSKIWRWFLLF